MYSYAAFTAVFAVLSTLVAAADPSGNPIYTPGSTTTVVPGVPFNITWQPTTPGTISLVLLQGDAQHLAVVGKIASGIQNIGSFLWTPNSGLQPGPTSTTGYGLQLLVDGTSQFQYSTQFGVAGSGSSSSSSSSNTATTSDSATAPGPSPYQSTTDSAAPVASTSVITDAPSGTTTTAAPTAATSAAQTPASSAAGMTTMPAYSTSAKTTLSMSTISKTTSMGSTSQSATQTASPTSVGTNAASSLKTSGAGLLAVAGLAFFAL